MTKFLFLILFLIASMTINAQRVVSHSSLFWLRYQANIGLKNGYSISAAAETRNYTDTWKPNLRLYSVDFIKDLDPTWSVAVGFMEMSLVFVPGKNGFIQQEVRPYFHFLQKTKISSRLTLQNRYRFEERFRQNVEKVSGEWTKPGGMYAYERIRFRSQLTYQLTSKESKLPLSLIAGEELIVHFGHDKVLNTFDQNRIYAQVRMQVLPQVDLTLGYTNVYQESVSTAGEYSDTNNFNFYINQRF